MIIEAIHEAIEKNENQGLKKGEDALPLWHPASLAELEKRDKLNSYTKNTIIEMAQKLDSVVKFKQLDDSDIYASKSNINYTGDKFENEAGEVRFHRFDSMEEEKVVEDQGWKRTEDSYLRNPALSALRVTGSKTMESLATPFNSNNVGSEDFHLLFMEVKVTNDDQLVIQPSPRMYDVMEFMQTAVLTTTHQYDDEKAMRKSLTNKGINASRQNIKDFRNLGYLNNVISDRRDQCTSLLGISRKDNLSFDDKQYYTKVGSSIANFCMGYMHREGIINRLASDNVVNSYGKVKATYEADRDGSNRNYTPAANDKELKRILEKYKRIDEALNSEKSAYKGRGLAIYEINNDVFEIFKENPGASKALFAHANRFNVREDHGRSIIYGKKEFEHENFRVDKYHDNAWQKGDTTIEIQNRMQNIAFEYDRAAYRMIKTLVEKDPNIELQIKKQMGYIPEDSIEFKRASQREKDSILARNKNYDTSWNNYMQNYVDGEFRFPGFMMATGRYMIETRATGDNSSLNPQVDKFHRFLIQTTAQGKSKLDLNNSDHVISLCKCVGFALGEAFDKKSTKQYLDGFNDMFKEKTGAKEDFVFVDKDSGEARLNTKFIGSEEFQKKVLPGFQKYILNGEVEEIGASLKNLAQLNVLSHKIMENIESGRSDVSEYKVAFMTEIDGTTNGQAIRVMSMPLGVTGEERAKDADLRRKGGLLEKDLYSQIGDYRSEGNADLYVTLSRNFHKLSKDEQYVDPAWREALVRFIGDDPDSKDSRNFFKKIGTVSGYGATRGMINSFDSVILEDFEKNQAKRAYDIQEIMTNSTNSKEDVEKIINIISEGEKDSLAFLKLRGMGENSNISNLDVLTLNEDSLGVGRTSTLGDDSIKNSSFYVIKKNEEGKYDFIPIQDNELSKVDFSNSVSMLNEDVMNDKVRKALLKECNGDALRETFGLSSDDKNKYIKTSEVLLPETMRDTIPGLYDLNLDINKTVNLQNEMMLNFKKDINLEIRKPGQTIYSFDDDKFKRGIGVFVELSYEDAMKSIERHTIGRVKFGDCIIPIGAAENQETFDRHGVELSVSQHIKGIETRNAVVSKRVIYEKELSDPGASANVYSTHPLDAMIMRETLADPKVNYSFNQVLDAAVVTQDQMTTVGNTYNSNFLKAVVTENPAKNILDHFAQSMDYMNKVYDSYKIEKPEHLKRWDSANKEFDSAGLDEKNPLYSKIDAYCNLKRSVEIITLNKKEVYKDMSIYTCCQMSGSQPYEKSADYEIRKNNLEIWHKKVDKKVGVKKVVKSEKAKTTASTKTKSKKKELD